MATITPESRFIVLLNESGDCIAKYEHAGASVEVIEHAEVEYPDTRDEFATYDAPDSFPP